MRVALSKHKGAYWNWAIERWYSNIGVKGKTIWLGWFDSDKEAGEAFKKAVVKYRKEPARKEYFAARAALKEAKAAQQPDHILKGFAEGYKRYLETL